VFLSLACHVCTDNGDGTVSCEEFEKNFLAMGFAERDQLRNESRAKQKRADEQRKIEEERKKQELSLKNVCISALLVSRRSNFKPACFTGVEMYV
jgi:hypothetical protein